MRGLFPGHYRPSDTELDDMLRNALIIFDTNVLLDLYRYSYDVRSDWLLVLNEIEPGRRWLPHKVAEEYQSSRISVIEAEHKMYDQLLSDYKTAVDGLRRAVELGRKHPYVDADNLDHVIDRSLADISDLIRTGRERHLTFSRDDLLGAGDQVREQLDRIFQGAVGEPSDADELREAERRIEANLPPGTRDTSKQTNSVADAVIWLQLLKHSSECERDICFVTGDTKADWWWRGRSGQTFGPLPQLVQEFSATTGYKYWQYKPEQFLRRTAAALGVHISSSTLESVRTVQQEKQRISDDSPVAAVQELLVREREFALRDAELSDKIEALALELETRRQAMDEIRSRETNDDASAADLAVTLNDMRRAVSNAEMRYDQWRNKRARQRAWHEVAVRKKLDRFGEQE